MSRPLFPLMDAVLVKGDHKVFVETGTYAGETTRWAAKRFKKVYTIEAEHGLYRAFLHDKPDNVEAIFGRSEDMLPDLIQRLDDQAVFWLDAHWSDGRVVYGQCPLLKELEAISSHKWRNHIVMADDMNLFRNLFDKAKNSMELRGYKAFFTSELGLFIPERYESFLEGILVAP